MIYGALLKQLMQGHFQPLTGGSSSNTKNFHSSSVGVAVGF